MCECGCHDSRLPCPPLCENCIKEKNKLLSYPNPSRLLFERVERLENLIKDNAGLIQRIGILGTALHEQSEQLNEAYNLRHLINHAQDGIDKCFGRIEEIESQCFTEQLNGLQERIAVEIDILKGFNVETQKGFNRLSERIDEVDNSTKEKHSDGIMCNCQLENRAHAITTSSRLNDLWTRQKFLEDRIVGLQKWKEAAIEKNIQDVERMRALEEAFLAAKTKTEILHEHMIQYHELVLGTCPINLEKTIRENMRGKAPHKCPICEGRLSGSISSYIGGERQVEKIHCHACEGKGIVWG